MRKNIKKGLWTLILIAVFVFTAGGIGVHAEENNSEIISEGLSVPENISLTNTTSGIEIKYNMVTGATGYYIYRSKNADSGYSLIGTVNSGSLLSFTDDGSVKSVKKGKTYYYKVYAFNSTTKSDASSVQAITYLPATEILTITNDSGNVKLEWKKVKVASGYCIYRKKKDGEFTKVKTIKNVEKTSWKDKDVKKNKKYEYYVVAYSGSSEGAIDKTASIIVPSIPKLLTVKKSSSQKILLKWKTNSEVTGYQIEYATNNSFTLNEKMIKVKGAAEASKVLTGLKGFKYHVRIRSYKKSDGQIYYSDWSASKSVTFKSKNTIFVGDSIMTGLYISSIGSKINLGGSKHVVAYTGINTQTFQTKKVFNGKNGVDKIISYNPTRVYLMLGMNEVSWRPFTEFKNAYGNIVKKIQKACPYAEIVILSVPPVKKSVLSRAPGFHRTDTCNEYLEKLAEECGCYYYDFAEEFKGSDGYMKAEYSGGDGIHWSNKGYTKFAELITAYDKSLD